MKEINQIFKATDALGRTYLYRFLGVDKGNDPTGCAYINLYNLTTQSYTNVEEDWFNQRKIEPIKNPQGYLCIPAWEFGSLFKDLGESYFKIGECFYRDGRRYTLIKDSDMFCFVSDTGCRIYVGEGIGTFHPYVANDGLGLTKSKWKAIHTSYREENIVFVDAWKTSNSNEEGKVIAKVNIATKEVEYLDESAKTDPYAQYEIQNVFAKTELNEASIEAVLVELDNKGYYQRFALTPEEFKKEFLDAREDMCPPSNEGDSYTLRPLVHVWYRTAFVGDETWKTFFTDMGDGLPESDIEEGNLAYIDEDSFQSLRKYLNVTL